MGGGKELGLKGLSRLVGGADETLVPTGGGKP